MDIIARDSTGNIVAREQATARYYPPATAEATSVEVFWRVVNPDGTKGVWNSLGTYAPGAKLSIPHNPAKDQHVEVATISYSPSGVPDVSYLEDALAATLIHQRETDAPDVEQVGASTALAIILAIRNFTKFAVRRKLRMAENSGMTTNLVVVEFNSSEYERGILPEALEITRAVSISPASAGYFNLAAGVDPAGGSFTKNGAGTTQADAGGWQINSLGSDGYLYYSKDSWPASPFTNGFTLEIAPPTVTSSDGAALPNDSIYVRLDDGTYRYQIRFDENEVYLNGGTGYTHNSKPVRLVIDAGGGSADLWVNGVLEVAAEAGLLSGGAGLLFGDIAAADDSDVIWKGLTYAQVAVPVKLAQTIFVAVSHSSGNAYGAESVPLEVTFANEGTETGGSVGDADLVPRDKFESTY
jgi:hypothetical protein